tara:strand:- start:6891 stop:7304 length:414 start_codon:yes stop_codon:yes gene_type:complete
MSEHLEDFLGSLSQEQKDRLLQMLGDSQSSPEPKQPETKSVAREPEQDFTMKIKKEGEEEGKVTGVPVNEMPRFNKFVDDGTEHKDKQNETPSLSLTERKRPPFKKVSQLCSRCNQTFDVHPQFARDFYICDKCLKR